MAPRRIATLSLLLRTIFLIFVLLITTSQAAPVHARKPKLLGLSKRSLHKHIMPLVPATPGSLRFMNNPDAARRRRRPRSIAPPNNNVIIKPDLLPRKGKRVMSMFEETLAELAAQGH